MSENNGNGRQRARARVAHLYLEEGLVDEARKELEVLIRELADGAEVDATEANGGGRPKGAWGGGARRAAKAKKARAPKKDAEPERPSRQSPEQEAAAVAERRAEPKPRSEGARTARDFTAPEKFEAAEYARQHTLGAAAERYGVAWATIRTWVERYPAGSKPPVPVPA